MASCTSLPFAALVQHNSVGQYAHYAHLDYLLEDYQISYDNSFSTLKQKLKRYHKKPWWKKLRALGLAYSTPDEYNVQVSASDMGLSDLAHAEEEINRVKNGVRERNLCSW